MTHFFWIIWNIVRNVKWKDGKVRIPEARQDESYKLTQSKSFSIIWIQHEMKFQYIALVCIVFMHDYTYWQAQTTNAWNVFNSTRNAAEGWESFTFMLCSLSPKTNVRVDETKTRRMLIINTFALKNLTLETRMRKIDFEASERKIWVTGEIRRSLSTIQFANKSSLSCCRRRQRRQKMKLRH